MLARNQTRTDGARSLAVCFCVRVHSDVTRCRLSVIIFERLIKHRSSKFCRKLSEF